MRKGEKERGEKKEKDYTRMSQRKREGRGVGTSEETRK